MATCSGSHYRDPTPSLFSFNSPLGACETCRGFGRVIGVDYGLVVPDASKTVRGGAIRPWQTQAYRALLLRALRHRWIVVLVWLAILGAGAWLFTTLKSELAPIEDRGVVFGIVSAPQGSTPQYTSAQLVPIERMYSEVTEAAAYTAFAGFPTVVDGNAILRPKAWEEREKKAQKIADDLRHRRRRSPTARTSPPDREPYGHRRSRHLPRDTRVHHRRGSRRGSRAAAGHPGRTRG